MFDENKVTKIKAARKAYKLGMKKEEYVATFIYNGNKEQMVHLGMDDYGQCYFVMFEFENEIKEMGCGTYNFDYLDCVYYVFEYMLKVEG